MLKNIYIEIFIFSLFRNIEIVLYSWEAYLTSIQSTYCTSPHHLHQHLEMFSNIPFFSPIVALIYIQGKVTEYGQCPNTDTLGISETINLKKKNINK